MKEVSVVIPTIGRVEYLDKAIESLLNQTIPFSEIIVFDNSVEQNISELSKFGNDTKVKWEKSGDKQLDPMNSWNNAVKCTSSKFVTIFGDDDIAYEEFHSAIQKLLEKSNFVYINYDVMDENDSVTKFNKLEEIIYPSEQFRHQRMKGSLGMMVPGAVFKKDVFLNIGGYETSCLANFLYSDDLLYFKIAEIENKVIFSGKSYWKYRVHSGQIGNLIRLNDFSKSSHLYIEKLEKRLKELKVAETNIYPSELQNNGYMYKLISDRFFIIITKLFKAKEYKLIFLNIFDYVNDSHLPITFKFKNLLKLFLKAGKKLVK